MALSGSGLAEEMRANMGFPSPTSVELIGWATGIVESVQSGVATFGNIPGPHPISGITGAGMAALVADYAGYGSISPELFNFCTGIANHITSSGVVTYTSPIPAPPAIPPAAAYFLGGTISGLNGSAMAAQVASAVGYPSVSPELLNQCKSIADHIIANAQVVSGVIS